MAKGNVLKWLQRGWDTFVDPERQKRVDELAEYLRRCIAKDKTTFKLAVALHGREVDPDELRLARIAVYRKYVERSLLDGAITDSERQSLSWAWIALELTEPELIEIHREAGSRAFQSVIAAAIDDGQIDESEAAQVEQIAAFMGHSVRDVTLTYFRNEGEHFLTGMFLAATEDGMLLRDEWARLLMSTQRLGFTRTELVQLIRPHAHRFVEHVLADAKSDERITSSEEASLNWLIHELDIDATFRKYAETEIQQLHLFEEIRAGRLPSITRRIPIELRAGEIVHFYGPARLQQLKQRKSGPVIETFDGHLAVTDARLIFDSQDRPFSVKLGSVISITREGRRLKLTAIPKATGLYDFGENSRLATLIVSVAVGRANQTIVDQGIGKPSRHIARDVRQRVWQRYGARCVDCGAPDYLEYDHIIPVAKGGSNDENNVQLLCRRCNLAKSDNI